MLISFDFDGTLHSEGRPLATGMSLLHWHAARGDCVIIVTSRNERHELPSWWETYEPNRVLVQAFVDRHRLPISGIVFCNHQPKAATLTRLTVDRHYDNEPFEAELCVQAGIHCVLLPEESHAASDYRRRRLDARSLLALRHG